MINFRDRQEAVPSAVTVISLVAMAATLLFMLLVPKPTTRGMDAKKRNQEFQVRLATDNARDQLAESRAANAKRLWTVPASQVAPTALDQVTRLAAARNLKVIALRPQRANDLEGVTQIPFLLTVEGSFPSALALARDMERPDRRMAVSLIQLSSADGASDKVTMSLGMSAFVAEAPKAAASNSAGGRRG